jgi:zinc protease
MYNFLRSIFGMIALTVIIGACQQKNSFSLKTAESGSYTYEYVTNDPLKARIYTLKNGLKVYLSQYKAEPRIYTMIPVRAGGKNDPANNTGLAHYLEHIMFKGTSSFGTVDWDKEKPLLDSIENLFNRYATLTDPQQRKEMYQLIDKVSNEASRFAIANEYDKMISELGGTGTNAFTWYDQTVYINDIPTNQLENWLQIEANRFRMITPRLFHTELEAVYEEKNRSLDNDYRKSFEALFSTLFPTHPYGTQTVIGTIEHLKNPSITEIKKYFDTYYRPNNVAICLSGDLDYDATIALIDKYFGDWQPNENLPEWKKTEEQPIAQPIVKEVIGPDAEWANIGFRFMGRTDEDYKKLRLLDMILSNSEAGLIDLNLKQQQKVLEPTSYVQGLRDYSVHVFSARPREGQTLEEVKDLLLSQIELVKKGEFEDWLITAVINDLKKNQIQQSEVNYFRADQLMSAFVNHMPWQQAVAEIEALRQITKEELVKFANDYYKENYVVVYKRTGKDENALKVEKPAITKVSLNKESKSPFHEGILANKVERLKPVFLDFEKDIQKLTMNKDVEILYTRNEENDLFMMYYIVDAGTNSDTRLPLAVEYLDYLGTDKLSPEDVKKEFYKLGTNFGVFAGEDRTYIYLQGLAENMEASVKLFEELLANAKADNASLQKMIDGVFKKRDDQKKDKFAILWQGLVNFGLYGNTSPFTNVLSNKALRELKSDELVSLIHNFTQMKHRVFYYGPAEDKKLVSLLNTYHRLPDEFQPLPAATKFQIADMSAPKVFWTNYDMVQAEIIFLSKADSFNIERQPAAQMFNEYFGGNMGSPVFQELREAQGLAYAAFANYSLADKKGQNDYFFGYIGTQADKQPESMKAMTELIQNFPKSEAGFDVARNAVLSRIESERVVKADKLFRYDDAQRKGIDYDIRKTVYEQVQNMTLEDVEAFQQQHVKGRPFNIVLVGDRAKLNLKDLQKYGAVQELTLDELFGYEKPVKVNVEKPM